MAAAVRSVVRRTLAPVRLVTSVPLALARPALARLARAVILVRLMAAPTPARVPLAQPHRALVRLA
jgi:hypothetical protein